MTDARRQHLRKFGIVTGLMIGLVFGLFLPWLIDLGRWPWMPWAIGGTLALFGAVAPQLLDRFEHYWMKADHAIGNVNIRILLAIVYFVVLTPTSLVMRALGKDPMNRRLDPEATSYRVPSDRREPRHMDNPF